METTVNTTKLFCELAFTSAEDFVKVAEEVLEQCENTYQVETILKYSPNKEVDENNEHEENKENEQKKCG